MSTSLCRACTHSFQVSEMTRLFDEVNRPLETATILSLISGIEITAMDERMPKFCCQRCTCNLEKANELRRLCQESDKKLRDMIVDDSVSVEQLPNAELKQEENSSDRLLTELVKIETIYPSDEEDVESSYDASKSDSDWLEDKPKQKRATKSRKLTVEKKNEKSDPSDAGKREPKRRSTKERKTYQCSTCGRMCRNNVQLTDHEATHLPEKTLKCHLCPSAFNTPKSLRRHLKKHDPAANQASQYKCDQCDKVLNSLTAFKGHMYSHKGERPFQCQQCPKAYSRASSLYAHVQQTHYKIKRFQCKLCLKAFTSRFLLGLHHTSTHERVKICPCAHCDKKYTSKSYLFQHYAEKHPETLEHVNRCAYCGLGYYMKGHYRKHIIQRHPERLSELEDFFKQN